jgi:hypothetical protein
MKWTHSVAKSQAEKEHGVRVEKRFKVAVGCVLLLLP